MMMRTMMISLANERRRMFALYLFAACLLLFSKEAASWVLMEPRVACGALHAGDRWARCGGGNSRWSRQQDRRTSSALNLFWFTGGNKDEENGGSSDNDGNNSNSLDGSGGSGGGGGGVARVMESMEKFKRVQQVGKLTQNLVQELTSTRVEGTAENGKIKVVVDGQQRPISVLIEESYWQQYVIQQQPPIEVHDLTAALTQAMLDAHNKAAERMDERMKAYYAELGLKPPT